MRRLIAILALMLIANVLSAQVQVSDSLSKNRFQVRINGTMKGNYSKGSCYADANSAGNIAIKFSGNDKLVTAYQAPSLYVVNGQTSSNRDSVLNRLSIIMLDFQCSTPVPPPPTEFSFCGSPLFDFWSPTNDEFEEDTITFCFAGSPICNSGLEKLTIHYYGSGVYFDSYNYGNCLRNAICKANVNECLGFTETSCAKTDTLYSLLDGEGYSILDTSISCLSDNIAPQTVDFIYNVLEQDTALIYSFVKTINTDTTIKTDLYYNDQSYVYRILGIKITDIVNDTSLIYISATPIKTSGQTYASNSFKIQKLAYADIDAPVITESVFNPNLGEQMADFDIDLGQNTYCIQVSDTNGNVAYTIFQLTKTPI